MISNRFIFSGILIGSLTLSGCGLFDAKSPANESGRTVLTVMESAVMVADTVCAGYALEKEDEQLALDCADAYNRAKEKLSAAEKMLNDKDSQLVCGVKLATSALQDFADILHARTGSVPDAVKYALMIGRGFSVQCKD